MAIGDDIGGAPIGGVIDADDTGVLAVVTSSTVAWTGAAIFEADLAVTTSSTVAFVAQATADGVMGVTTSSTVAFTAEADAAAFFIM